VTTPNKGETRGPGINPKRPRWEAVYNAYNSFGPINDNDDGAIRVLKSIIKASGGNETNGKFNRILETIQRQPDSRTKVKALKDWLSGESEWKAVEEKVTYPNKTTDRKATVVNKIGGITGDLLRNGVYIILGSKTNGGHKSRATLWIGAKKDVIDGFNFIEENHNVGDLLNRYKHPHDYSNYEVCFWELEEDHPCKCGKAHVANKNCRYGNVCNSPRTRVQDVLGCCHVNVIRDKINKTSELIGDIGPRLKELWNRYESRLTIHSIDSNAAEMAWFGNDVRNPNVGPGIFINIAKGMNKLNGDYFGLKAYEVIVHEFFHNIDYLIAQDIGDISNVYNRKWCIPEMFSYGFHKNKIPEHIKFYPNFCWRLINGFAEEIISETRGLVVYNNKKNYYENYYGNKISNDAASMSYNVEKVYTSPNAGLIYIIQGGRMARENYMYAATYGTNGSYWEESTLLTEIMIESYRHHLDQNQEKDIYHCKLSSEAFANMAAAAITNRDAKKDTFIQMTEILPKSCSYFIKMLNMICEMLKNVPQHER